MFIKKSKYEICNKMESQYNLEKEILFSLELLKNLFAVLNCHLNVLFPSVFIFFFVEQNIELIVFAFGSYTQFSIRWSAEYSSRFIKGTVFILFFIFIRLNLTNFVKNKPPFLFYWLTFLDCTIQF